MKKIILLMLIIIPIIGNTQKSQPLTPEEYDVSLQWYVSGEWEHVKSTYPSGNEDFYYRKFELYQDSIYRCTKIHNSDTIIDIGMWFVRDTAIYLYMMIDTFTVLTDVSVVDHVDEKNMFVRKIWGVEEMRKTSYYKRTK